MKFVDTQHRVDFKPFFELDVEWFYFVQHPLVASKRAKRSYASEIHFGS
jgi:hypothetical protein